MDLQRLILFFALSLTLLMMWQAWQDDYGPKPPVAEQPPAVSDGVPQAPPAAVPEAPAPAGRAEAPVAQVLKSANRVRVITDVFDIEIDTVGGDLRQARLLQYPVAADNPDEPVQLLADSPTQLYVAQSALLPAGSTTLAPNHHAVFQAAQRVYRLGPGEDSLRVPLTWRQDGIEVTKVYTFKRGQYLIDVGFEIRNASEQPWQGRVYRQLQRTPPTRTSRFLYTYTGGVIWSPAEKYEKIKFDKMEENPLSRTVEGGWAAMIQHYFLSAWIPNPQFSEHFYSKALPGERYILGMTGPLLEAPPGGSTKVDSQLFIGPKLQDRLTEIAPGLELTVDYGWLTFIAKPLFWLLEKVHDLVGNWGWSIIILTILIKLAFFRLSATSYKSMAQMRKLQPRLQALKERFGDDRQKMQEAMMKMYREEKINPLGGCLPILVQIPVFIALYWTLLESVEMRQAPFILWLQDLSSPDPFYILPLLMGATMLIQHRLNPTPMDPIQARVMMVLPIVFTVFFAFFPAGLVLYWVVNNTLSISQQWYITRYLVKA